MIRFAIAAFTLGLVACSPPGTPVVPESEAKPVLSYTDAFVMEPIGERDMTVGGVTVSVEGGDVRLIAASSDDADTIEIHTMSMEDGRMRMRQVDGFDIADGETLELKRGGNHFMVFGVSENVIAGETVDMTLVFKTGEEELVLVVEADVRAVGE